MAGYTHVIVASALYMTCERASKPPDYSSCLFMAYLEYVPR